jgi:hypothetical protein
VVFTCALSSSKSRAQTNRVPGPPAKANAAAATRANPESEPKARSLPYRGNLVSADSQRMTITVGTRTFQVSTRTKIEKAGKPATLSDGIPGQIVTGSYRKLPDARLEAVSVYFGGKAKGSALEEKAGKSRTSKQ